MTSPNDYPDDVELGLSDEEAEWLEEPDAPHDPACPCADWDGEDE